MERRQQQKVKVTKAEVVLVAVDEAGRPRADPRGSRDRRLDSVRP